MGKNQKTGGPQGNEAGIQAAVWIVNWELGGIKDRTGRIREIRGRGLMIALELEDEPGAPFTARIYRELVRRGYVVGLKPGLNVLRLDPSLTIEREDVEGFLETFEAVLTGWPGMCEAKARPGDAHLTQSRERGKRVISLCLFLVSSRLGVKTVLISHAKPRR